MVLEVLVHIFFISFFLNILIVFYAIYTFFEMIVFHHLQGSKLKIKKSQF